MKKILWLFLMMPLTLLAQQREFEITGKIGNYSSPYKISVSYKAKGESKTLSGDLQNGVFDIKGVVDSIQIAYLQFSNSADKQSMSEAIRIWLEPGKLQVNSVAGIGSSVVSGTPLNDQALALSTERLSYKQVSDINQQEALNKASTIKFIKLHPNSLLSVVELDINLSRGVPDISLVEPLFNGLTPDVKSSPLGIAYQQKLIGWKGVNIGAIAPDFTQPDQNGKLVKLSDFKGKYVFLDFWASWCHPCRDEHPALITQYNLYKDKNFVMLAVSIDGGGFGTKESWLKAIADDHVGDWVQVCDLTGDKKNKVEKLYGVGSIPQNFLIGPDGKIIAKSLTTNEVASKLKEIFNSAAAIGTPTSSVPPGVKVMSLVPTKSVTQPVTAAAGMATATSAQATKFEDKKLSDNDTLKLDSSVRMGKLSNGFTYYVKKNKEPENRVFFYLPNKVGSILENDDQQGLAHFMEHMNFNGTTHFPKNQLVDYLQKAGVRFGADINAYTSFNETVYQLPIPSDKPDIVNNGIEIMHDWAQGALLDEGEINSERGVILEEERLGKGAGNRMQKKMLPLIFNGSRYADRLPIGKDTVLKYFKPETIRQFFYDWYRPDLQALIVVGDIDVNQMERRIKEKFSDLKNPVNEKKRIYYDIPLTGKNQFVKLTDKEQSRTIVQVMYKHRQAPFKTAADYKTYLMHELFNKMLTGRFEELGDSKNNPPFINAGGGINNFLANVDQYAVSAVAKPGDLEKSFKAIWYVTEQIKRFGFTGTELERAKKAVLESRDKAIAEKDKTYSGTFVNEYVQNFLSDTPSPGLPAEQQLTKQYLPLITLDDLLKLTDEYIKGTDRDIVLMAPEKDNQTLPDEARINQWINEVNSGAVIPYQDKFKEKPLLTKQPVAGKIVSEKQLPAIKATEWILSNRAKVIIKPTDFEADGISFSAIAPGGNSVYPDKDYHALSNLPYIITTSGMGDYSFGELNQFLSGKDVGIGLGFGNYAASIAGHASAKSLDLMFQLAYLDFTSPRYDRKAFDGTISSLKASIKEVNEPDEVYQDTVSAVILNHNIRASHLTTQQADQIIPDRIFEVYKKQFGDAANFTFVFAGNIDLAKLRPLVEKYIASLPSNGSHLRARNLLMYPPAGKITKTVYKGSENKSSVNITFSGKYDFNAVNNKLLDALKEIIQIRVLTRLREQESGVYSPNVLAVYNKLPEERYRLRIGFGCAPENVEKLIASALDEVNKIKINGPEEVDVEKFKAEDQTTRELNLRSNDFWLNYIQNQLANNQNLNEVNEYENMMKLVTTESIKAAANKYLSGNNMIQIILKPENAQRKN